MLIENLFFCNIQKSKCSVGSFESEIGHYTTRAPYFSSRVSIMCMVMASIYTKVHLKIWALPQGECSGGMQEKCLDIGRTLASTWPMSFVDTCGIIMTDVQWTKQEYGSRDWWIGHLNLNYVISILCWFDINEQCFRQLLSLLICNTWMLHSIVKFQFGGIKVRFNLVLFCFIY